MGCEQGTERKEAHGIGGSQSPNANSSGPADFWDLCPPLPPPPIRCLFLFGQASVPLRRVEVSVVCRKDVTRLQERRVTKWRTIVLSAQRDAGSDSREDGIISSSDKSLTGPEAAAVCGRARLSGAAHFTHRAAAELPSQPRIRGRNAERLCRD